MESSVRTAKDKSVIEYVVKNIVKDGTQGEDNGSGMKKEIIGN
jgi:hypothetical protein